MAEYHFPIPGHEEDKIVIFTRRHWISMLGTIILIALMFLIPIVILAAMFFTNRGIFSGIALNFIVIGGSIYYLVAAAYAFTEWISYYYDIFIVTEDEIIDINQEGIFDRSITEVSLLRVQDVSARIKGFLPTIFAYGDVVAESAGENTRTYIIDSIPNPVEVANKILALHNEHIAREGRTREVMTAEGDLRKGVVEKPAEIASEFQAAPSSPAPPTQPTQGEIKKDDLNEGGEVKF